MTQHFPFDTPLLRVEVETVVAYHDVPRLFFGLDRKGETWLVLWADEHETDSGGQDDWLCVHLSPSRLLEVKSGQIDLHATFSKPESGELVYVECPWPGGEDSARRVKPEELDPELFHEPGVRLGP